MAETPGNDHIAPSGLSLWEKGGKAQVSFFFRKITDRANLKSLQDHNQCWESLMSCLALGLDCSHILFKFLAHEPVSPVFLLCSCSSEGQAAAFNTGALYHWISTPDCKVICKRWEQRMREQKDTRHEGGSNIKYHGYFDEVVPCGKRQNNMQEGGFKRSGAEKSPHTWHWLDLTRKKVKRLLA